MNNFKDFVIKHNPPCKITDLAREMWIHKVWLDAKTCFEWAEKFYLEVELREETKVIKVNRQKIKDLLQGLELDFAYQINSLNNNDDLSWDCYDLGNWKSSHDSIIKIAKILELELNNNIQEGINE